MPLPASLVVKKGSKRRARTSGAMPQPVSATVSRIPALAPDGGEGDAGAVSIDEAASLRHGVARVHREVQDHLLELARVGPHGGEVAGQSGVSSSMSSPITRSSMARVPRTTHVQVDDPRLRHLLAGEAQELAGELRPRAPPRA